MSDVIGRGVIEVSVDSTRVKAGIDDAKRSIKDLGIAQAEVTKSSSASIDRYIQRLGAQAVTTGKSARETELLKLGLRGASDAQLAAADSALRLKERHQELLTIGEQLKTGFLAIGLAAGTGLIAAAVAFDHLVKSAGEFQHLGEKIGDTAESVASLAVAAAVGGVQMDSVVAASARLTKNLTGVDDDSKSAGAAIKALGLNLADFKNLKPADQFEAVAKALNGFEEGTGKTAVAMALFGKSGADMLPFLKELGGETGRQNILTAEQIHLAKEYSDRQAKLHAQISLYASAIATEMLPAFNDLSAAFLDIIKNMAGVEAGADGLGNSTAIQDFAESAADKLAFVVDAGDGVARVFRLIGTSIAAVAALQQAAFSGSLTQAASILSDLNANFDRILNAPTLGQKLEDQRAKRKAAPGETKPELNRPKLNFEGASKDSQDAASQEAKAQLAFDLQQIKAASEAIIGTFANAEKVMQAMRSAGLIDEKQYYTSKLGFLNLNSQEQEAELQKEIGRLQQEKLIGKDKIDNDRKIAEAQAKLAKVREDAVANVEINSIQEAAANRRIEQSYIDAERAEADYLGILRETNAVKLASMSLGDLEASRLAGRLQIDKKYIEEEKALNKSRSTAEFNGTSFAPGTDAKARYDKQLALIQQFHATALSEYDTYYAELLKKEGDWSVGAIKALENYYDESRNIAKQSEELFTNAFKGMEDALVDFVTTGKLSFRSLADSIIADISRMAIKQSITGPLAKYLSNSLSGLFNSGGGSPEASSFMGGAIGNDGNSFGALLGSFATGTDFVPRTGPYLLHQGEKVTSAAENAGGLAPINITQNFPPGTDRTTVNQAASAAGRAIQRAMRKNN